MNYHLTPARMAILKEKTASLGEMQRDWVVQRIRSREALVSLVVGGDAGCLRSGRKAPGSYAGNKLKGVMDRRKKAPSEGNHGNPNGRWCACGLHSGYI